jgi:hypothetical protein
VSQSVRQTYAREREVTIDDIAIPLVENMYFNKQVQTDGITVRLINSACVQALT